MSRVQNPVSAFAIIDHFFQAEVRRPASWEDRRRARRNLPRRKPSLTTTRDRA